MRSIADLVPILQTAIGPVILISGVGLVLLTMTNRLGRVVDRARLLAGSYAQSAEPLRQRLDAQLAVLWARARILRVSIALASVSVLAAALLVILLFVVAFAGLEAGWLVVILFAVCLGALIASLAGFLQDVHQALEALKVEIEADLGREI